jgi:hypothetical protein
MSRARLGRSCAVHQEHRGHGALPEPHAAHPTRGSCVTWSGARGSKGVESETGTLGSHRDQSIALGHSPVTVPPQCGRALPIHVKMGEARGSLGCPR